MLLAAEVAGYHGADATLRKLKIEGGASVASLEDAWARGQRMAAAGLLCGCEACKAKAAASKPPRACEASHAPAKATAAKALASRQRPTTTISRGLYDSARPWPAMRAIIGECPHCHSTLTITVEAREASRA